MNDSYEPHRDEESVLSKEILNRGTAMQVFEGSFGVILMLSAFTGNLLVCLAVYRSPKLRTVPNFYITTLAVADMLMSVLAMPLTLVSNISSRWIFGGTLCQFQGFVITVLATVSLFTITLTALNRYFKIVRTRKYPTLYTNTKAFRSIVAVWVVSLGLPILYLSRGNRYRYHPAKCICLFDLDRIRIQFALTAIPCYVCMPFVVISFCYLQVYRTVRSHKTNMATSRQGGSAQPNDSGREIKIAKLLLAIFVAFLLSWTPFVVIDVLSVFLGQFSLPRSVYVVYSLSTGLSSCTNPLIYGLMNNDFRSELKAMLHFKDVCGTHSTPVVAFRRTNQASRLVTAFRSRQQVPGLQLSPLLKFDPRVPTPDL